MRKILLVLTIVVGAIVIFKSGYHFGQKVDDQLHPASQTTAQTTAANSGQTQMIKATGQNSRDERTYRSGSASTNNIRTVAQSTLPSEAQSVIAAIQHGGPYAYPRDGIPFQNREHLLPQQSRGYYREFTVKTPGESDRGAKRIITGGQPVVEMYYSDDHYDSFRKIQTEE